MKFDIIKNEYEGENFVCTDIPCNPLKDLDFQMPSILENILILSALAICLRILCLISLCVLVNK